MISFALRCEPQGHGFDGWFRSGEDFERQVAGSLVNCPVCGATDVAKALMAPAVGAGRSTGQEGAAEAAAAFAKLQEIARQVRAKGENVGPRFADEARKIHYGETEARQIYGEASRGEVKQLAEEGIAALPLLPLPEDKN